MPQGALRWEVLEDGFRFLIRSFDRASNQVNVANLGCYGPIERRNGEVHIEVIHRPSGHFILFEVLQLENVQVGLGYFEEMEEWL